MLIWLLCVYTCMFGQVCTKHQKNLKIFCLNSHNSQCRQHLPPYRRCFPDASWEKILTCRIGMLYKYYNVTHCLIYKCKNNLHANAHFLLITRTLSLSCWDWLIDWFTDLLIDLLICVDLSKTSCTLRCIDFVLSGCNVNFFTQQLLLTIIYHSSLFVIFVVFYYFRCMKMTGVKFGVIISFFLS